MKEKSKKYRTGFKTILFITLSAASFSPLLSLISESAGDNLYSQEKYDLALNEYLRIYLSGSKSESVKNKLALGFMRTGRYRESLEYLDSNSFSSRYLRLYASLKSGYEGMAMESYLFIRDSDQFSGAEKNTAGILAGTLYLEKGDYKNAKKHYGYFAEHSMNHDEKITSSKVLSSIQDFENKPVKSRVLAGILSGLLPGSGQMYAGHYTDGVISLLINGFLIGSALYTNQAESRAGMGHGGSSIIGFFALVFYSANISGAVNSARRYNQYQERVFHKEIRENFFNLNAVEKKASISFSTSLR